MWLDLRSGALVGRDLCGLIGFSDVVFSGFWLRNSLDYQVGFS